MGRITTVALLFFLIRDAEDTIHECPEDEPTSRVDALLEVSFLPLSLR